MPLVYIATEDRLVKKNLSNIEEIKSRNGNMIGIISEDYKDYRFLFKYSIFITKNK